MRRVLAGAALLAGAACPPHGEAIPLIHVDPRAAGRLDWLGHGVAPRAPARVHVLGAADGLAGPNVTGRPGDLVLENGEVVFVVDQLDAPKGFAESGGNLVDAADARGRQDELGQVFTYFGKFPRQGVYDHLDSGTDPDGSAWIEARGRELREPALKVTTRYTLRAPDRALLLETSVENTGAAALVLPGVGDAIEWGGAEKTAPGKPPGFTGASRGPYVGGVGRRASYAVAATDGDLDAVSGRSWTDTTERADVAVAPGQTVRYGRVFVVGERPDTASLVGELALASGAPVGAFEALLPDRGALPTGFGLALRPEGASEGLTLSAPFKASVPVGRYRVFDGAGRSVGGPVEVVAGHVTEAPVAVDAPASFDARCVGAGGAPMPCKVTFEGTGSTATPSLGVPDASGPAGSQVTTATGEIHVDLAAGTYRVTASRGPEYALASADVTLAAGERAPARTFALDRVLYTRGYVACDFHQHSLRSMDSGVALRDRATASAAEGVEIAVASEHNVVSDLEPVVRELGLEREMVSLAGDELTSDALASPWGHANAYPLAVDPAQPRGGHPSLQGRTPGDVFAGIRGATRDVVIQINHPRSGRTGYFDLLGFDPKTGAGAAPGYDATFDALEVWNGRNVTARAQILSDFLALLRTAHPVTPVADTDTHGIVGQEAGYPRTYVRVADDAHLEAWDAARSADLVRGVKTLRDVVLTNGPMLRVDAGGAPIGGVARGRSLRVKVEVESAPWVEVTEVSLVRASGAPDDTRAVVQKPSAGALAASVTFDLHADKDDAFVVIARGSRPLSPVLAGAASEISPWAMTGAIWIDASGGGVLGRARPSK